MFDIFVYLLVASTLHPCRGHTSTPHAEEPLASAWRAAARASRAAQGGGENGWGKGSLGTFGISMKFVHEAVPEAHPDRSIVCWCRLLTSCYLWEDYYGKGIGEVLVTLAQNLEYRICNRIRTSRGDFQNSRHKDVFYCFTGSKQPSFSRIQSAVADLCFHVFPQKQEPPSRGRMEDLGPVFAWSLNESIALGNGFVRICQWGRTLEWGSWAEFVKIQDATTYRDSLYNCVSQHLQIPF